MSSFKNEGLDIVTFNNGGEKYVCHLDADMALDLAFKILKYAGVRMIIRHLFDGLKTGKKYFIMK